MVKHYLTIEIEVDGDNAYVAPYKNGIQLLRELLDCMEAQEAPCLNCYNEKGEVALWMDWSLSPQFILKHARKREEQARAISGMFAEIHKTAN